ncbi:MAG TPA: hypothetical protein VFA72_03295, partial [Burkholderiales bacterium]|nr:hypothetical protein [Burkholderiales bacterium]
EATQGRMTREERLDLRGQRAFHVTRSRNADSLPAARFGSEPRPVVWAPVYQAPMPLHSRQPGQAFGFAMDRSRGLRAMGKCCARGSRGAIAVRRGVASKAAENRRGLWRRALPLSASH